MAEQSTGSIPVSSNDPRKRLNPDTLLPFKKGDIREDGFIFRTYEKSKVLETGFYKESWLSPAAHSNFKRLSKNAIEKCQKEKYKQRREFLDSIKLSKGCERCGYKEHPCALDFAHKNAKEKSFSLSHRLCGNKAKILAEIEKCRILCSNCHRLETHGVISFEC